MAFKRAVEIESSDDKEGALFSFYKKDWFREVLTSSQIIFSFDNQGLVKSGNVRFQEFSGFDLNSIEEGGVAVSLAVSPNNSDEFQSRIEKRAGYFFWETDTSLIASDGSIKWLKCHVFCVQQTIGEKIEYIASGFDISLNQIKELERQKAIEAERRAMNTKTELMAMMSHEIRTPINGILGMTNLLKDTILSEEQSEFAKGIVESGLNLLSIVNDILDYSKIEAGLMEIEDVEFDLSEMLNEWVKTISYSIGQKPLKIKVEAEVFANAVIADSCRIRQVIYNLLSNAIKFTQEGTIVVRAKKSVHQERPVIFFEVEDQGIGISAAVQKKLFKPFSQGQPSIANRYGGTGLGLSICKKILELMNGQIGVESEEGKGSKFWFFIPMVNGSAIQDFKDRKLNAKASFSAERTKNFDKKKRVLVVEDQYINLRIIVKQLEKYGFSVDGVGSGTEAIESVRKFNYDAILMDCVMPDIDGYTTTRIIRESKDKRVATIPIIAMTANALKGDREKCLDAGMDDYVSKPVEFDQFIPILDSWCSRKTYNKVEIDFKKLSDLKELDPNDEDGLVADLLNRFFKGFPERYEKIKAAVDEGNQSILSKEAHALKSTCGNLGAVSMARLCDQLEHLSDRDFKSTSLILVDKLNREFIETREALETLVSKN